MVPSHLDTRSSLTMRMLARLKADCAVVAMPSPPVLFSLRLFRIDLDALMAAFSLPIEGDDSSFSFFFCFKIFARYSAASLAFRCCRCCVSASDTNFLFCVDAATRRLSFVDCKSIAGPRSRFFCFSSIDLCRMSGGNTDPCGVSKFCYFKMRL